MNRQLKKMIASMLVMAVVVSNSNMTVYAEAVNGSEESEMFESASESEKEALDLESTEEGEVLETEMQEAPQEDSEDAMSEEIEVNAEDAASVENQENAESAAPEETQEITENATAEKKQDEPSEAEDGDSEEIHLSLELITQGEDSTVVSEITILDVQELVEFSQKEASTYQKAIIKMAPHDTSEWDLSGTQFQGLGSDEYPFKGSIGFSGEYTGYITLDKSLFNAISGDAQIASTLNLKAANDMTDPILAKKYVAGDSSETTPQTISLKIGAKSTDTTEGGEQTSYSSFGGIIGTLGAGASVSLNITNDIPAAKTAVNGDDNRGFFCNTLERV